MKIQIISNQILTEVPSASGIIKFKDNYYVVGDDSPFLFHLNKHFKLISKTPIYSTSNLKGKIINKKDKPDFETLELVNKNEMIAFGSGSKSPERDIFTHILLTDKLKVKTYNITSFYNSLRRLKILENKELNIEAIAFYKKNIYLFNRGHNVVFNFIYKDLIAYFKGLVPLPKPKTTSFELPKINGVKAGFSGATAFTNKPYIIFTASIENTDNAYDDGEILGSIVGVIDITNNEVSNLYKSVILPNQEPLKVESVTISNEITEKEIDIILVTDSDGQNSNLLECRLKW